MISDGRLRLDLKLVTAFIVVYIVWGSTYLAIRVMVEYLPPILAAGVRFLIAGSLLLAYALLRGQRLPSGLSDWVTIGITSLMMLVGANGLVTWSEQWVDSNQAALIVATSALWIAWLGTLGRDGQAIVATVWGGLIFGLVGVAVLVGEGMKLGTVPWFAYLALLVSPFLWALGSIISKRHPAQASPLVVAALQTLMAGWVMTTAGLAAGESSRWSWEPHGLLALAYLVIFGTCLAYTCFFWLVHRVSPAQLGTYAYVNPAVAVLLGSWILDEHLSTMQIAGTLIILASVFVVTLAPALQRKFSRT